MEKQRVAFIGLGVMGYPMAGYLSKAGYETKVYNRTKAKADKWAAEYNGIACETPREAAEGCDIVFTCVGNDNDVRSVVYGEEGLLVGLKAGAVLVDHTTTSAELAVELADACKKSGQSLYRCASLGWSSGRRKWRIDHHVRW